MAVSVTEQKAKIERLNELEISGLNIPRFYYLPHLSTGDSIERAISWAETIHKSSPEQIFNVRTYNYNYVSGKESISTPHLTDIPFNDLYRIISSAVNSYSIMIDAEIPDNGRLAGNILIQQSPRSPINITIEFVIRKKRAMVRDINSSLLRSFSFIYNNLDSILFPSIPETENSLPVFLFIIHKAMSFPNKILEFTYFKSPSGIFYNSDKLFPENQVVWWEWRKF